MLSFSGSLRVFVALEPCDMRKGFSGLEALVTQRLKESVRGGALFLFTNKRRTRLKALYFDGTGLWLLNKRLEVGRFSWPVSTDPTAVKLRLRPEAFVLLCDGVQMQGAKFLPWYEREP
ncbi:IS66 family insertion sequence element accessory protein TnpB [Ruficoccus sp. ZRK36]|uniref:IS66 family insertion sequence element accessory protein TnpB n=1 Tax=Ruficoccus sp. ZRK36 TaxID=2866311 RepID=UPI001C7389D4|nr:IS66 family insertion sequence element accessory protein TnpB [Ruficoccus sp. ZRK36]QYY35470.1 IS66 family insertion sequence element accessory protein TnpB [Ruficoccus sp. ZRK36]QYY37429.1 IS66 family insertion sequence element accessory protein TnpB [Ruficoccus sp. ZRK36]